MIEQPAAETRTVSLRVPTSRPWITYALLVVIGAAFVAETLLGGSTSTATLVRLGAQVNTSVAEGELWRLVAAMFLHIGLSHILFNGWALFSLGREVESFYGSPRFIVLYFVAGVAGNIAYYVAGGEGLSAGASGAVFGIIGAEAAYFLMNRKLFGAVGRQRLGNVAILIGINLVFGFTVPGINNLAHLGGLVAGFLLGLGLSPRFALDRVSYLQTGLPKVLNRRSTLVELLALVAIVGVIVGGWQLGNRRWQNSAVMLRAEAESAYNDGDLAAAQTLLERAVSVEPDDHISLFNLGVVYLQQGLPDQAIGVLERARSSGADDEDTLFMLGVAYAASEQADRGRSLLEEFLVKEPSGQRADYARSLLDQLP